MKNILFKTQFIALLFLLITKTTIAQWSKVAIVDSFKRDREITFVIGDTAYVGVGDSGNFLYSADFRGYTQNSNAWAHIRPFPIAAGDAGFSFVINDTAYVGGGANPGYLNEFYAYTPSAGWINMGSTPGGVVRAFGVGFSIGDKGYSGTGVSNGTPLDDFWQYDPSTNSWISEAPYPHPADGCVAFAVNGKGYIGLGQNAGPGAYNDMYQYDPASNTWDTMASMPTSWGLCEASYFVICGKLIVALGDSVFPAGSFTTRQTWLFDPSDGPKGTWTRLQNFPGPLPDYAASGFTMGDTGFIYGGCNYPTNFYRAALYRYVPTVATITNADTTVCAGAQVTLSASGGVSYLWSNTDTTVSITISPADTTTYFVTVNGAVCIGRDSVIVNVNNNVSILTIKPQSPSICSGQSITLIAKDTGSFTWSPSTGLSAITGDSVVANDTVTTIYSVSGESSDGCAFIGMDTVKIIPAPALIILPQDTSICNGSSVTLIVPASGSGYVWSPSSSLNSSIGNSIIATPTKQTTYNVTGIDSLGCTVSDSDVIYISKGINKPIITDTNNVLTTTATQGNQWYRNDAEIGGATGEKYTITDTGCYWDIATNIANGCSSISDTICVKKLAGIQQLTINPSQLSIYPNPTGGEIFVNISSSVANVNDWNLQITDVLGRRVYTKLSLNYSNDIDLSNLAGGVYFITVINKTSWAVFPVVRQN